jgi:nucleoside-diphosphate-sugar epimerase
MQYEPRLKPGSKILVTGVNGLVASHVADQALKAGYKVVGTVRDAKKAQWMKDRFDKEYGVGSFEIATVLDIAADNAFDEAVKGEAAVTSKRLWLMWQVSLVSLMWHPSLVA